MSATPVLTVAATLAQGDFVLDVAFDAGPGITGLFGPSGAGKTTLLHLVAGLLRPDHGRIALGARVLTGTAERIFVPPARRRIGLVYQDAQLFPHMTVGQNIAFGRWFAARRHLRRGTNGIEETPRPDALTVEMLAETLGIGALLDRRPAKLSGGERQRVALARAILASPELLLLDEPLAALDDERRSEILSLIEDIRDRLAIPMLYVSHRSDELMRLASHAVVLDRGQVSAVGAAQEVLARR